MLFEIRIAWYIVFCKVFFNQLKIETAILAACILFLIRMLSEANTIVVSINGLYFGKKSREIFDTNMNRYQIMKEEEVKLNRLRMKTVTLDKRLQVEHLTFSYPNGETIFEDASIEI